MGYNKTKAAEALGLQRSTFRGWLDKGVGFVHITGTEDEPVFTLYTPKAF